MEELVAELGAAFLCADIALTPTLRDDHAAYIESWLKVLKPTAARSFQPLPMRNAPPITSTACNRNKPRRWPRQPRIRFVTQQPRGRKP